MASTTKVFVTGITGYIGGTALDLLLKKESSTTKYQIRALVRSAEKAEQDIRPLGIEPVIGSLDDVDIIQKEAADADVVLHFASTGHQPSVKAILQGLLHRTTHAHQRKRPIFIHTSGVSIVLDHAKGQYKSHDIYRDDDEAKLKAIPHDLLNRNVDVEILSPDLVGKVDTYVVVPTTVWGTGSGPVNKKSVQIPHQVEYSLKSKQALQIGKGLNVWSHIHVNDLGHFYVSLLERSLAEPQEPGVVGSLPKNTEGYYFVENGDLSYGEVAQEIAATFKELGINSSGEVKSVDADNKAEVEKYFAPFSDFLIGGNSRLRTVKGREILGWEPKLKDLKGHIDEEVHRQLRLSQK